MHPLPYLLVFLVPISVFIGYSLGGIFTFLSPVLIFGIIPFLDLFLGLNKWNPEDDKEKTLSEKKIYRWITFLCVPVQLFTVFYFTYIAATRDLPVLELTGLAVSVGMVSGVIGINVAHELVHRVNTRFEPLLGFAMLWSTLYMHWGVEHVIGHHKMVATREDPATARRNEIVYFFLFRTVIGGLISSWSLETERLRRKKVKFIWLQHRILLFVLLQAATVAAIFFILGPVGALFFVGQGVVGFTLLEVVNYIEHYGLARRKLENGEYEKVQPWHSWDSANRLTNWFLFNLERHSDHHFKPNRRYQVLRHHPESPQLPTGYAGMILFALVPPLWMAVMHPRIDEIEKSTA